MNQSYLNGPLHEMFKRLKTTKEILTKLLQWDHIPSLRDGILVLRFVYYAIGYHWSTPDGPVSIVKVWMLFMDIFFGRLYPLNQNPICRSANHSSILSKKQYIGWFL